jgi:hypothetical protein
MIFHFVLCFRACSNVNDLTIDTPLVFYSKLIDNPSLISIFKQIKILELNTGNFYFHPDFALKLAQRFPSLKSIELEVISFDDCLCIIDVFLTQMENLFRVKVKYHQRTTLDDPFSRDYVIRKRRESFPDHALDEKMVNVKNDGKDIRIWLS